MGTSVREPSTLPFVRWTIEQAKKAAAVAAAVLAAVKLNREFVNGNHWQNGDGWIGPWPTLTSASTEADSDGITTLQAEIQKAFTPRNAIAEVVDRHVGGVIGIEPRWRFTLRARVVDEETPLSDAEEREQAEIEEMLTEWWDEIGAHAMLQTAIRKLLYSDEAGVVLRIYVPAGLLTTGPNGERQLRVPRNDVRQALAKIRIDAPEPEAARVITEEKSGLDVGIYITKDANERESVELTYVDENGQTSLAVIRPPETATSDANRVAQTWNLGGRLLMTAITRLRYLSAEVRQAQRALNYANTMIVRNVTTGGFLEQVLLNAKLPGHWEEGDDGSRRYIADPIVRGPGVVTSYAGHEVEDAQGNKTLTTPSVVWREPVTPDHSIKAKHEYYADVLDETDQRHVLISGDAMASAVSRVQARADFAQSLRLTRAPLQRAGRWLLETVLAYAEALAGVPGKYTGAWRASFECIIDTGPLTPEEMTAIRENATGRLISRGTARELIGVSDPDAERERIETEEGPDLAAEAQRATIYKTWVEGGIAEAAAASRAGLSDEEIDELLDGFEEPPDPADPDSGPPVPDPANAGA